LDPVVPLLDLLEQLLLTSLDRVDLCLKLLLLAGCFLEDLLQFFKELRENRVLRSEAVQFGFGLVGGGQPGVWGQRGRRGTVRALAGDRSGLPIADGVHFAGARVEVLAFPEPCSRCASGLALTFRT